MIIFLSGLYGMILILLTKNTQCPWTSPRMPWAN